jgi:hypothetical protein
MLLRGAKRWPLDMNGKRVASRLLNSTASVKQHLRNAPESSVGFSQTSRFEGAL